MHVTLETKMPMKILTHAFPAALMTAAIMLSTPVLSQDTEIYFSEAKADDDTNKPAANVLFLIDTSGSMCQYDGGGRTQNCDQATSRMNKLKAAFNIMIDSLDERVSVGVGKFNGGHDNNGYGGYIFHPVTPMTNSAKSTIKSSVASLRGTANTPTAEAYSEMARYMLGLSPTDYAKRGEAVDSSPQPAVNMHYRYDSCATRDWRNRCQAGYIWTSDSRYDSPVDFRNQCETNHIIVMTDGEPTRDTDAASINNITGGSCTIVSPGDNNDVVDSFSCQSSLASWLYNDGEDLPSRKSIKTWQVGFGINSTSTQATRMRTVAKAGGTDEVKFADNAEELAQAFLDIMNMIDRNTRSIASPGVAVSQSNRFQNLDEMYYAIFEPAESSYWQGNLKRYRIDHVNQRIVDRTGRSAIETDTARFDSESSSFWSNTKDGADITQGGAREQVGTRKLFYTTRPGSNLVPMNFSSPPESQFFGLGRNQNTERTALLNELKNMWGDPLHSEPLMVNYGTRANGSERNYVFVSTNAGMLHAIDTTDGSERFAFMPYELISKANQFTIQRPGLGQHNLRQIYGLDGSWVAWRKPGASSKTYLYGGMRRGGNSYYALDVTNIDSPQMLWQITPDTAGFEKLGETWSKPKMAYFPDAQGKPIPVVVFGGGYSPEDHDRTPAQYTNGTYPNRSATDRKGNAIYAVNAETGALVWSASTPDMKWAIPGSIAVTDLNSDGITDHLYFGDLGGQVFRVNIDSSPARNHSVNLIAQLGGNGENHRRFYEQPAVAFVREGSKPVLYVTIGSGYRAHPKDTTTREAIFVIKDEAALQPASTTVATLSNLQNVTAGTEIESIDPDKRGWYYFLQDNGEKVLASPVVFDYQILFTTYAPTEQNSEDVCVVRYGESFLHRVDLRTGNAVNSVDGTGIRRQKLDQSTPPPTPTILFGEDGRLSVVVGTEVITDDDGNGGFDEERIQRLRSMRSGRWMQLTPDAAGKIRNPGAED